MRMTHRRDLTLAPKVGGTRRLRSEDMISVNLCKNLGDQRSESPQPGLVNLEMTRTTDIAFRKHNFNTEASTSEQREAWGGNWAMCSSDSGRHDEDASLIHRNGRQPNKQRKSKGTTLSRKLPFGEALNQSNKRRKKFESKSSWGSNQECFDNFSDGGVVDLGKTKPFTIVNRDLGAQGGSADDAIVEFNKSLRSENAELKAKLESEASKNAANENRIRELEALEKVLKNENLTLRKDLTKAEANSMSLERRIELSKEVKFDEPWRKATCLVLDNFRAAAKISEDALVRIGVELERKDEFKKAAEIRTPECLKFCSEEVAEVEVIKDSITGYYGKKVKSKAPVAEKKASKN